MIPGREALALPRDGNLPFVADVRSHDTLPSRARRVELAAGQQPFAVILGCSDSRVPVEIVFDQGLGDLFVIRVAGNIVAPSLVGSVEFAASQFGTRLVVVMGHTQCGAIRATLDALEAEGAAESRNQQSIVDRIKPHVGQFVSASFGSSAPTGARDEERFYAAVRANVVSSAAELRRSSPLLDDR